MLLVTPRRRACSSPTAATRNASHEELDAAGVDARDRDRAHRRRAARAARAARSRPDRGSGSRSTASPGRSRASYADAFEGVELVPGRRARRGAAPGEGRGRDRPHPARVRDRRRRVPVAAADAGRAARPSAQFALALEFAMRERGASGNSFDPIIAAGPERREAAPRAERPRHRAQRARRLRLRLHRRRATAPT